MRSATGTISIASLCTLALWFATTGLAAAELPPVPNMTELQLVQKIDPDFLHRLAESVKTDSSGAVGLNLPTFDQVGVQNQSAYVVPDALVRQDRAELDRALSVLEYAFDHQRPDGSFVYSDTGAVGVPPVVLTKDASAAFLLYDLGRSLCLMGESTWFNQDPTTEPERLRVAKLKRRALPSLDWLITQAPVLRTDFLATNRVFDYAMSYYLLGKALSRKDAMALGKTYLETALRQEDASGVFPELGGFDSSYEGVSLFHSQVLFLQLAPDEISLRKRLWSAIGLAANREQQAVLPDGTISTLKNTRVRAGGEKVFNAEKRVDGRSVSLGLTYHAYLVESPALEETAKRVARRYFLLAN